MRQYWTAMNGHVPSKEPIVVGDDPGAAQETILVVEDNEALRLGLVSNLERDGYRVTSAADGVDGTRKAIAAAPDLIILDIMLPGRSGLELLADIRRRSWDLPVLILSARNRAEDKVEGLDRGADDYLAKPFELPELLARVRAMLRRRRTDHALERPIAFGRAVLDRVRHEVTVDGRRLELSAKEFGVLSFLASSPGRPRSREEILERVWGWGFDGSPRTVDNFILSLRQKLEDHPARPRHILTVRGVGYKLVIGE
jgi:DNA-binding response OmpR family regulator